jgi:hypothetical protein
MSEGVSKIQQIYQLLEELRKEVCPHCAANETLLCEVIEGVRWHITGECEASNLWSVATLLDDLRDQFFSEFNPEHKLRIRGDVYAGWVRRDGES